MESYVLSEICKHVTLGGLSDVCLLHFLLYSNGRGLDAYLFVKL